MSTFPEPAPNDPEETPSGEPSDAPASDPLSPVNTPEPSGEWTGEPEAPNPQPQSTAPGILAPPPTAEEIRREPTSPYPMFAGVILPARPREERIPHLGHLGLLAGLAVSAWLAAGMVLIFALEIHLWDITSLSVAATDYRYNLASQAVQYLITFAACLGIFPIVWHRPFFDGIHWRGSFAAQRAGRLAGAAIFCFFVAMINGVLMPGPANAPIDQLFKSPGAAWAMFGFGITLAPFFEEMAFRGFLLPSFCTAFDWIAEQLTSAESRRVDASGRPKWKPAASIVAMLIVGVPFLALVPHPKIRVFERVLFVLCWGLAMALWWARTRERNIDSVPPIDADYHPLWSIPAMAVVSVFTSIPFAMMHGVQTSWSLGPFLLLIFVSLVLCWVRLRWRSLAASTIVHACYNLMLFSFMLLGTGGFKHLDKM